MTRLLAAALTGLLLLPAWASARPCDFDGAAPRLTAASCAPRHFLPGPLRLDAAKPAAAEGVPGGQALLDEIRRALRRTHRPRGYTEARHYMFATADNAAPEGVRGILESYSLVFVPGASDDPRQYPERGDQNGDGFVDAGGMNVEHVWPQSFFGRRGPMRSDLHQLLPTFIHPNSVRGHSPFGEVEGPPDYSNNGGARAGLGEFEPPDRVKGQVARAMLYFYARYGCDRITEAPYSDGFWRDSLETLLRWQRERPPSAPERERNDRVERFQGNRNPFVDDPALADRVGVETFRRPPGRCD